MATALVWAFATVIAAFVGIIIYIIQYFARKKTSRSLKDPSATGNIWLEINCRKCGLNNQISWDRKEEIKCISCDSTLSVHDRIN